MNIYVLHREGLRRIHSKELTGASSRLEARMGYDRTGPFPLTENVSLLGHAGVHKLVI